MDLGEAIVNIVTNKQGCKATEIAPLIVENYPEFISQLDRVVDTVEQLIEAGILVEVEYILPSMPYRIKSFLLPKGTEVL